METEIEVRGMSEGKRRERELRVETGCMEEMVNGQEGKIRKGGKREGVE